MGLIFDKMVEDTSLSQDMVEISGNVAHKIVSFDKDVVEIKLADTIDSDKYGGNFVKDVCIDEGTLFHPKILEEKTMDRRQSPKVSCQMTEANSDMTYWKKDDARKSVNELKQEAIVPVELAPSCTNEKQCSTGKEYDDHDGSATTDCITGDPSEKKIISLQELLLLESAEESRLASTVSCESSAKQHPPKDEDGQASINSNHEIQAILPKTSDYVSNIVSSTMSDDQREALDMKRPNQIDRHNPFVDHRSLVVEDILEPACSIPSITDDASTEPMSTVSKTDSFSNVVSGSAELTEVKTGESGLDAASSSNQDIQLSEGNDDSETRASKAITEAVDEVGVATASPCNNGENKNKCDANSISDVHCTSQIDEENDIDKDNAVRNVLAEFDYAAAQTAPESSRSTSRTGNGDPYVSNLFGPSIMSAPLSDSGHIAYSGNISLRSDSSATGSRSFAFPVLQREWMSSPVRMAKAEHRHARMRFGWRKGLICCKF